MATQRFEITDGPGKWDLMLGLFDGTCTNPRRVAFTLWSNLLEKGFYLRLLLSGVSREDGSGESWIVTGYVNDNSGISGRAIKGYYSTRTRKGHLDIIE